MRTVCYVEGFFLYRYYRRTKGKVQKFSAVFYFLDLHKVFINIMLQYDLLSKSRLCFK